MAETLSTEQEEASRLECWRGALPAVFTLAADELCGIRAPRPFYKCLPRQSLLPFVCESVREHFAPYGPPMGGQMWFESNGVPLRWQLPIGVLFDLLVGTDSRSAAITLPWQITIHFTSFPSGTLLQATLKEAESVLLNALKESCYLRCGSAEPAMSLSPTQQQTLARSLASSDDASYSDAYRPVAEAITAAIGARLNAQPVRAVPIRVLTSAISWRQQPFTPLRDDGSPTTLHDALTSLLPQHFPRQSIDVSGVGDSIQQDASGAATVQSGERSSGAYQQLAAGSSDDSMRRVIVQGVHVPLDVGLQQLASQCSHPDGWLYVCVYLT